VEGARAGLDIHILGHKLGLRISLCQNILYRLDTSVENTLDDLCTPAKYDDHVGSWLKTARLRVADSFFALSHRKNDAELFVIHCRSQSYKDSCSFKAQLFDTHFEHGRTSAGAAKRRRKTVTSNTTTQRKAFPGQNLSSKTFRYC